MNSMCFKLASYGYNAHSDLDSWVVPVVVHDGPGKLRHVAFALQSPPWAAMRWNPAGSNCMRCTHA